MRGLVLLGSFVFAAAVPAQWVAFNDHVPGTQTHSNATRLKIPAGSVPFTTTNIFLKNISSGADLPVMLTITRSANGTFYDGNGANPASGTPLYNNFHTFVDFSANSDSNVGLVSNMTGAITYTFSGLNPSNFYSFRGGAVRGNSSHTNRWTLVELQGAASFTNAHSPRVITTAQVGSLALNQAAVTFGWNTTSGDMIAWENIDPGPDGSFAVQCTHYTGSVTNPGSSTGTNAWAITGIRLEEIPSGPPILTVQPTNQTVYSGENATFSVSAVGTAPLNYKWYKNDVLIDGATGTSHSTGPTVFADNSAVYYVTISNTLGTATSSNAVLTVVSSPPIILVQPQDQSVTAPAAASFAVAATGSKPLSYQWYRNGSMIPGASASNYTTAATSIGDSGSKYSCMIMNNVGTTNSRDALLTVTVLPQIVVSYTNIWRYFTNGTDLGTAWQAPGYDDSSWAQGPGWLGHETDAAGVIPMLNTDLPFNGVGGVRIRTYYFRTHFTIGDPNAIMLVSSNYIDDGAVFYFNGHELAPRYNLYQAPSPINYQTLAVAAVPEGLTAIFTNVIPADFLVPGDNVVAVELHQINDTSSDIDFGMGLTAFFIPPTPLAVTSSPQDRTVADGASTTFSVGFTGNSPAFQWYKWINGTPVAIPGATSQSYTISTVFLFDSGYYFVVLSNSFGSVFSSAALLTVIADTDAPKLVVADGTVSPTQITLSFSEPVSAATGTNVANYVLTNITSGGVLPISAVMLLNASTVVLATSARAFGENYLLLVRDVRDVSTHQNPIAPDSAIPVSSSISLIGLTDPVWDFYNPVLGPPWEPYEPPPDWKDIDFQVPDFDWGHDAAGLFAYNPNQQALPAPVNTTLSSGAISSYFRSSFDFAASPLGATLSLRQIIDDGVVTYLNGAEIYRFNMPTGAVNALTPASQSRTASDTGDIALPTPVLLQGTNVLAAELHGFSNIDHDLAFGAELKAQILSWARGPVLITAGPEDVAVPEGSSADFSFVGVGPSGFQWQTNGVDVPGGRGPILRLEQVPLDWNGMLVRVLASNSTSMAVSTNARLHVIADQTPPSLLSTLMQSNGIVLTFSEALSPASATNLANYRLANAIDGSFQFVSASLLSPSNVLLTVNPVPPGDYRVFVSGLRDRSSAQNEIATNTSATIGFRLAIPFDAVWKFNTNGADLGNAWRAINFDDTTPDWPSGPGLIADETAPLPEVIRTPISRLVNGQYHYTFYFRYHFFLPFLTTNKLSGTFRHIIDDGAIMYINGQEFYRFNMTNSAADVTYTSEASFIGDAILNGPFTYTFTNLVAGDNVMAVEVHQNGNNSSDITFGVGFFAEVPPLVFPGDVPALQISRRYGNLIISWSGSGFTLESSDGLGPGAQWQPVSNQSNPYFASPLASGQRFYRLRK